MVEHIDPLADTNVQQPGLCGLWDRVEFAWIIFVDLAQRQEPTSLTVDVVHRLTVSFDLGLELSELEAGRRSLLLERPKDETAHVQTRVSHAQQMNVSHCYLVNILSLVLGSYKTQASKKATHKSASHSTYCSFLARRAWGPWPGVVVPCYTPT